jgi:hypothetical protein
MPELKLFRKKKFDIDNRTIEVPQQHEFWEEARKIAKEDGVDAELIKKNSSLIVRSYLNRNELEMKDFLEMLNPALSRASVGSILTNDNTAPLFETLVESFVRGSYEKTGRANELVMGTVNIDQQTTSWYYADDTNDDEFDFKTIAQGGPIPVMTVKLAEGRMIQVYKRGGGIELTDEAKSAKIDMLSAYFKKQGMVLGRTDERMVVTRLMNGYFDDGFDAPTWIGVETPGTLTPMDMWYAQNYMEDKTGFTPNRAVMNLKTAKMWTAMETKQGMPIFLQNQLNGTTPDILASKPFISDQMPDGQIMLLDTNFAINEYVYKPMSTEIDRNKKTQIDGSYTTKTSDYVPFEKKARMIVDITKPLA